MTTDKTPATLAVDVLAAMQELEDELQSAANYSGEGCYWSRDDDDLLRRSGEARAAVAELIEAAGNLRADVFLWRLTGNMPNLQMLANDEEALDAALSRVKGESA